MRKVYVIGIGQTKIDEHWQKSLRELAGEAVLASIADSGMEQVEALFVGNMMSGSANHQQHLGAYIADWCGLRFKETMKVESACSSGAAAFRSALMAVASGAVETAIAAGVEKMTDSPIQEITSELATAADAEWEGVQGISFVALNALIMRRYMYEYGWKKEDFAPFSMNAHSNAVNNPFARFHEPITAAAYAKAPMITDPINLLDSSPIGDGSAAAFLISEDGLKNIQGKKLVRILGSGAATDTITIQNRRDPLWLKAAELSSKIAFAQAALSPKDIHIFETHDAFTIMAALSLEACGFAERGKCPQLAQEGEITLKGRIPISTLGGLKARGHPVGATGIYQIVEVVQQLRGEAGGSQVDGAKYGMTLNIGGSGSSIITHIFSSN